MTITASGPTRAQIAAALPRGSRRLRGQLEAVRRGLSCAALLSVRADFRAHLESFWRIHVNHMSWGRPGQLARGLSAPTRARVCELAGFSVSTYKACRRWWEAQGYLAIVRAGWTPALRAAVLASDEDRNESQAYALCAPRAVAGPDPDPPAEEVDSQAAARGGAITRPLTRSRRDLGSPARRSGGSGSDTSIERTGPLARGPVGQLTDGWWRYLTRPFTGWSARDLAWAVDHDPDGRQHRNSISSVKHPAGWLRWRLGRWLGADGRPLPSRTEQLAASAEASRAEAAATRAMLAAQRAQRLDDAGQAAAAAAARSMLTARRSAGGTGRPPGGRNQEGNRIMRISLDSAMWDNIATIDWPHKIGYYNGAVFAWTAEQIAEARGKGQLLALVDVTGADWRNAAIIDWEKYDVQNPAVLAEWVRQRNANYDGDAVVYCSRSSLATVMNALAQDHWRLWLADPVPSGEPPFRAPDLSLPRNITLAGIQYALAPASGGPYDLTLWYDDSWHRQPGDAARRQLAVTGGTLPPLLAQHATAMLVHENEAAAATMTPTAAASTVPGQQIAPEPAAAANLGTSQAPGVSGSGESTEPLTEAPRLPHAWIAHTLAEARKVAAMLHGNGMSSAAAELDRGIAHAFEAGGLLKRAGL